MSICPKKEIALRHLRTRFLNFKIAKMQPGQKLNFYKLMIREVTPNSEASITTMPRSTDTGRKTLKEQGNPERKKINFHFPKKKFFRMKRAPEIDFLHVVDNVESDSRRKN